MKSIRKLSKLDQQIGALKLALYVKEAINQGHSNETIFYLLDIYLDDVYGGESGSTDANE